MTDRVDGCPVRADASRHLQYTAQQQTDMYIKSVVPNHTIAFMCVGVGVGRLN